MNVCNTCGINDGNGIAILAERIFDNVRIELSRESASVLISNSLTNATPLYASGTGTLLEAQSTLTVTPHSCSTDLCGDLNLQGNLVYVVSGIRYIIPCTPSFPVCLNMKTPSASMWPTNLTVDYSFFIDELTFTSETSLSGVADAAVIAYITSKTPICVSSSGSVAFNSAATRTLQQQSDFVSCDFYPFTEQNSIGR